MRIQSPSSLDRGGEFSGRPCLRWLSFDAQKINHRSSAPSLYSVPNCPASLSAPSCHPKYKVRVFIVTRIVNRQTNSVSDSTSVMATTKSAAAESKKRKRGLNVDDIISLFDAEPEDYEASWNEIKVHITALGDKKRQTIPSVSFLKSCVIGITGLTLIACAFDP